jgi:hypothetical protein
MATTSYLTPEDQAFINAWRTQTAGTSYAKWGTTLPKLYSYADKLKNIQSFYTDAKTPETKQLAIDLGVEWLKANNPGVLDSNGNEFKPGFYSDIISGDKTTKKFANDTLNKIRDTNATQYVNSVLNADGTLGAVQKAAEITKITQGTTAQPYNPTRLATAVNSIRSNAIVKPGTSVDTLKANYGGLKKADGTPLFSNVDFQEVADAKTLGAVTKFNNKLDSLADKVVNSTASTYVTADPVKTAAAKKALISDPTNFVTSVNALNKPTTTSTDTATTTDTTTTKPAGGVASLRTWRAPQQGIVTANSPYSGLLDATLAKITGANFGTPTNNAVYKNLTDPLTQGMGLDSLAKPELTYDTTNEAGITGLGNVSGTLDKLNTQVTSSPTYNQNQIANADTALENAANIAGKVVNPPVVNPPVVNPPVVNPTTEQAVTTGPWNELGITQAQYEAGQKSFADAKLLAANARLSHYETDKALADKLGITKDQYANDQNAYTKVRSAATTLAGQTQPAVTQQPAPILTTGIVDGVGTNPALRAKVLTAQPAVTQQPAPILTTGIVDGVGTNPALRAKVLTAQAAQTATNNGIGSLTQGTDNVNQNLVPTNTDNTISPISGVPTKTEDGLQAERQAGLVALANQQAATKAEADSLVALGRNPDGGPSSLAPINPNTYGPQQITLAPNTVGPITAAQRDLGPLNISNLGAVISPQAMNSNAGGVASLVGPQVTVQPQQNAGGLPSLVGPVAPAVTYTYEPSSQQQLEDKAVNAGYQGDYTDTAAMNSFINANNQSVAPAVTQQPAPIRTTGIVNGVGTNPALRAKVLAAQAAQASNMKV